MVARGSWRAVGAKKLSAMPAGALRTVVASCILGQPGLAAARIAEAAVVRTRRGVRGSGVGLARNAPRLFDGLVLQEDGGVRGRCFFGLIRRRGGTEVRSFAKS